MILLQPSQTKLEGLVGRWLKKPQRSVKAIVGSLIFGRLFDAMSGYSCETILTGVRTEDSLIHGEDMFACIISF